MDSYWKELSGRFFVRRRRAAADRLNLQNKNKRDAPVVGCQSQDVLESRFGSAWNSCKEQTLTRRKGACRDRIDSFSTVLGAPLATRRARQGTKRVECPSSARAVPSFPFREPSEPSPQNSRRAFVLMGRWREARLRTVLANSARC